MIAAVRDSPGLSTRMMKGTSVLAPGMENRTVEGRMELKSREQDIWLEGRGSGSSPPIQTTNGSGTIITVSPTVL